MSYEDYLPEGVTALSIAQAARDVLRAAKIRYGRAPWRYLSRSNYMKEGKVVLPDLESALFRVLCYLDARGYETAMERMERLHSMVNSAVFRHDMSKKSTDQ